MRKTILPLRKGPGEAAGMMEKGLSNSGGGVNEIDRRQ